MHKVLRTKSTQMESCEISCSDSIGPDIRVWRGHRDPVPVVAVVVYACCRAQWVNMPDPIIRKSLVYSKMTVPAFVSDLSNPEALLAVATIHVRDVHV